MGDPVKKLEPWTGVDPVCGMEVSEESAYHFQHDGIEYRFCSEHCEKRFAGDPSAYLNDKGTDQTTEHAHNHAESCHSCQHDHTTKDVTHQPVAGTVYTCPMHPEIQENQPGTCPKCGMALEPMGEPVAATRTEYTCPMHPEIVQDHPGSCPKCGIALEPHTVDVEERNEELIDMSRRVWVSAMLALLVFLLAMVADLAPGWLPDALSMKTVQWIEFILATPVVLWLQRCRPAVSGDFPAQHVA
jgi:Cu+-exporting ATPase